MTQTNRKRASKVTERIATQRMLYGDEPPDLDDLDDLSLNDLWETWQHAQELRYASGLLGTELVSRMASTVPENEEVKLGGDLWRWKTEGTWKPTDPKALMAWLWENAEGDVAKLSRWVLALFSGFRISALDAIAEEIGLDPRAARNTFAHFATAGDKDEQVFGRIPDLRIPKYAQDMDHLEMRNRG